MTCIQGFFNLFILYYYSRHNLNSVFFLFFNFRCCYQSNEVLRCTATLFFSLSFFVVGFTYLHGCSDVFVLYIIALHLLAVYFFLFSFSCSNAVFALPVVVCVWFSHYIINKQDLFKFLGCI